MAHLTATLVSAQQTPSTHHVLCPGHNPSWCASHNHLITTTRSPTGFTTTWTCDQSIRLCITTAHAPRASCLAHFPSLNPFGTRTSAPHSVSLVVATFRFITIATPAADIVRIPIGDPLTDPNSALHLFPLPEGLILRTLHPPHYQFLSHPLHSPVPVALPDDHLILHTFVDVPIIISRASSTLSVWSAVPVEAFASDTVDHLHQPVLPSLQLSLDESRSLSIHPTHPVTTFLAHDIRGLLVLCLVFDSVLTGLSIEKQGQFFVVKPSFRIRDVCSAVPILALRKHHRSLDILIQHSDDTLSLFMGRNRLCAVGLSGPPHVSGKSLGQATTDEFSLGSHSGAPRFSMRDVGFSNPLVRSSLAAISFALERAGAMRRVTAVYHELLLSRRRPSSPASSEVGPWSSNLDEEWQNFENVLLRVSAQCATSLVNDPMESDRPPPSPPHQYEEGDESWYSLLSSNFRSDHARNFPCISANNNFSTITDSQSLGPTTSDNDLIRPIIAALHMLYEDRKLTTLSEQDCFRLARLNVRLAKRVGYDRYISYYCRDFPELIDCEDVEHKFASGLSGPAVPSVFDHLTAMIRKTDFAHLQNLFSLDEKLSSPQPDSWTASWRVNVPFKRTRRVISCYKLLFCPSANHDRLNDVEARCTEVLLNMVRENFTRIDFECLPFGVALPIRDALWKCRSNPQPDWPSYAFALICREDLFHYTDGDADTGVRAGDDAELVHESRALLRIQASAAEEVQFKERITISPNPQENSDDPGYVRTKLYLDDKGDGCDMHDPIFHLRFRTDRRVDEVRRILRSIDVVLMTAVESQGNEANPEYDLVAEQKRKLELLLRKRFAAPVGRGAFTLRTFLPSDPTRPLAVPKLCLSGRLYAEQATKITFTPADPSRLQWAEFHNGVAAGLRIVAADLNKGSEAGQILTRSWIVNHRSSDTSGSSTHAGMLLALGLGGYLPALRKTDYYQYLVPRHELTAIGLMLGLSAGNVGSMDEKITKMLCLHIRPFNEAGFSVPDFQISVNVQTAAILGLGFLHQGSCENSLLEGLFSEFSRRPRPGDLVDDREAHSLALGLSIGLICLGHGKSAFDAADRRRIDRLLLYANGGSMDKLLATNNQYENATTKSDVIGTQDRSNMALAESETSRIREGNFVNTDVLTPGAVMALTLIYLKTNDKWIADRLVIPETLYSLDRSRPDHVYLRLLSRSLIMWDHIEAKREWISASLPNLLVPLNDNNDPFDLLGKVRVDDCLSEYVVDLDGILHARALSVAGLCTAMAVKFAGTNDKVAVGLLTEECLAFEKVLTSMDEVNESKEWVYSSGLCAAVLALSIVSAGSGDLDVLRLLRRLRKRKGPGSEHGRYGMHMAMHMAIGFLFLGGGCHTFGTSKVGVVGLLCAIYPQFPRDVGDNQYHLQALRHLYVLATEPRCIETRDVDTGASCCVDVEIRMKDGSLIMKQAPCIVPQAAQIAEVAVIGERYLGRLVHINPPLSEKGWFSSSRRQVVLVKRKPGHLPYTADPQGAKGIVSRSVTWVRPGSKGNEDYVREIGHLVRAFSGDADILAFVEYFCGQNSAEGDERLVEMVYDCLAQDTRWGVKTQLDARRVGKAARKGELDISATGSILLVDAYAGHCDPDISRLMGNNLLSSVVETVWDSVDKKSTRAVLMSHIVSGGVEWPRDKVLRRQLAVMLRLSGIGTTCCLVRLACAVRLAVEKRKDLWLELKDDVVQGLCERGIETIARAYEEASCEEVPFWSEEANSMRVEPQVAR